jgi:soluble lytic murein transglycosylase-like protein
MEKELPMRIPRRRPPPPWRRGADAERTAYSRARRRFPAQEDETGPLYDGAGEPRGDRGRPRRRDGSLLDRVRRNPIRHGVIGLTVAGAAIPLALERQNAERVNPEHEQSLLPSVLPNVDDLAIAQVWQTASARADEAKAAAREAKIEEAMERYAQYNVDRKLAEDIYDLAREENVDPDVAFGLVQAESDFMNSATSHVGAIGLTQLMPKTARWLEPGVTNRDLRDQRTNLRIGFKYLSQMMDKYNGDERLALLAYNRGPGTVDRVLKQGGNPDNGYVEMVRRGMP